jgi:hypothetical protein
MKIRKCSLNISGPSEVSLTVDGSHEKGKYLFYYGKRTTQFRNGFFVTKLLETAVKVVFY